MSNRLTLRIALSIAGLAVTGLVLRGYLRSSDFKETRTAAFEIRAAAIRWQVDHGDSLCPIVKQLIEGKYLLPHTSGVDAWDQPFSITCSELTIGVVSRGPDGIKDSTDDIIAPAAPVR